MVKMCRKFIIVTKLFKVGLVLSVSFGRGVLLDLLVGGGVLEHVVDLGMEVGPV